VLPIQLQEALNAPGIYLYGMHPDALTLTDDDLDEVRPPGYPCLMSSLA